MRMSLLTFAFTTLLAAAPSATADSKVPATEPTLGPVSFDAQGADFTAWLNQFKEQVYGRWVLPPAIPEGRRLRVNVELTLERSGAVSHMRILERSRSADFDKAAQAAVRNARFLPLLC
jgi:TonB family protein